MLKNQKSKMKLKKMKKIIKFFFYLYAFSIIILFISSQLIFETNILPYFHFGVKKQTRGISQVQLFQLQKNKEISMKLMTKDEYECIGFKVTKNCDPNGYVEENRPCYSSIPGNFSGYCELRNKASGEIFHVMKRHCNSLQPSIDLACNESFNFVNFNIYTEKVLEKYEKKDKFIQQNESKSEHKNGIIISAYPKILSSVYAGIKLLRRYGCTLPIEIWYTTNEMSESNTVFSLLIKEFDIIPRSIEDSSIKGFFIKIHAIAHSSFQNVLLLDADNFAVKDPTYLFNSKEFKQHGAIFWPDYWHPKNTIFNVHNQSLLWEYTGLDYIDMFEQESGQVLINRQQHRKPLQLLLFYIHHKPNLFSSEQLVWGDKDLFRLAWLRSKSSFYMISTPPSPIGFHDEKNNRFCGVSMLQYDQYGEMLFLHRNQGKIVGLESLHHIWTDIEIFHGPLEEYSIVSKEWRHKKYYKIQSGKLRGVSKFIFTNIPGTFMCYGNRVKKSHVNLLSIKQTSFSTIEKDIFTYVKEVPNQILS